MGISQWNLALWLHKVKNAGNNFETIVPSTKTIITKVKIRVIVTMAAESGNNKDILVMWAKSDKINFCMW